jgi:hypothetical protein
VAAARKSGLKARLSQNLMTFLVSVQRFVVGHFGEKAVNLGERKLVVRWGLGGTPSLPVRILKVQRLRILRDSTLGLVRGAGWEVDLNF